MLELFPTFSRPDSTYICDSAEGSEPGMKDDAELVAAAMAGGPDAFGPVVERYQDAVFGIALARLRDFHDAEDAAQAVFVEAFERLDNLGDPARLGAWLRSITIHRCIDRLRRQRETADLGQNAEPVSNTPMPHEALERGCPGEIEGNPKIDRFAAEVTAQLLNQGIKSGRPLAS